MSEFEVIARLNAFGQNHISDYLTNPLTTRDEAQQILNQLSRLDFEASVKNFRQATSACAEIPKTFTPVSRNVNLQTESEETLRLYETIGYQAIGGNHVGVVIMSGGQGTRLGFDGPKGMYRIGLLSEKSIFQIQIERILKMKQLAAEFTHRDASEVKVQLYIMTSDLNHEVITQFFTENSFFGYPKEEIIFFRQNLEVCFTTEGQMILESLSSLSLAPDGNGGVYRSLLASSCVTHMEANRIRYLHIYGIDNILTKAIDPHFIGCCVSNSVEVGNKVVWRAHKSEKVGVTAEAEGGRMHIIEYSEIPIDLAEKEDTNGKLLFGAANLCNHYLSVDFLINTVLPNLQSSFHVAHKKIPYLDLALTRQVVRPTSNNGIKLELFIFDVFPLAKNWIVVEGAREDEFAPVKNAPGRESVDSPDSAREMMSQQAIRWLIKAGAVIEIKEEFRQREQDRPCLCEISPLLSYGGEGLESFRDKTIQLPCYLA